MKIGIVGTGNMGRAIGLTLSKQGHDVFFGARSSDKAQAAADLSGGKAKYGTNQEAAEFGEIIYYNPRDVHPEEVLSDTGSLDGKIVMESNNGPVPEDYSFEPVIESRSEKLQKQIPEAVVVKAFNTMSQEVFEVERDELIKNKIACFVACDDEEARKTVMQLAKDIGFEPVDSGTLRQARLLEPAADLIRMIIGTRRDLGATFSITSLTIPDEKEFGGRRESKLS